MAKINGINVAQPKSPGTGSADTAFSVLPPTGSASLFRVSGDGTTTVSGALTVTGSSFIQIPSASSSGIIVANPHDANNTSYSFQLQDALGRNNIWMKSWSSGGSSYTGEMYVNNIINVGFGTVINGNTIKHGFNNILYIQNGGGITNLAGNVAIGSTAITSPSSRLHIRGAGATSTTIGLRVENANAIESLVVNDANNVLIGTTTDSGFRLDVNGTARIQGALTTNLTSGSVPFVGASGLLTQDNNNLFWDNVNKRLGVGTSSPTEKLSINGSINFTTPAYLKSHTNNIIAGQDTFGSYLFAGTNSANTPAWLFIGRMNTDTIFQTNGGLERMRIASGGNVGIGTTSPQARLDVRAQGALSTDIAFRVRNSADNFDIIRATGDGSVFIGQGAGNVNTGVYNTANGFNALFSNTTGIYNTANGVNSLRFNTTGNSNTTIGAFALQNNTTGGENTALGANSLQNNITGNNNTANGNSAGRFIADGTTANTITNNSVFLGVGTKALANSQTNQIVIGHNAIGAGSNTVVLGNDSIVTTALKGNVGIGTTSPQARLDVRAQGALSTDIAFRVRNSEDTLNLVTVQGNGNVGIGTDTPEDTAILDVSSTKKGFLPPRMTESQRDDISTPANGLMIYNTDREEINVYTNNNGWRTLAYA
jgi:hypothetical protein